jgi:hypothetical protein
MLGLPGGWLAARAGGLIEAESTGLTMRVFTSLLSLLHTAQAVLHSQPRTIIKQ